MGRRDDFELFPKARYFWTHKVSHKVSLWCLESDEYHFCQADALWSGLWPGFASQAGDPPPVSISPVSLQTHKPRIRGVSGARPRLTGERREDAEQRRRRDRGPSWTTSKLKVVMSGNFLPEPAWSGPICLLGPRCKGYFNLNSNDTNITLLEIAEYKSFLFALLHLFSIYICLPGRCLPVTPTNILLQLLSLSFICAKFLNCMN